MRRWMGFLGVPLAAACVAGLLINAFLGRPRAVLGVIALPGGQATLAIDARSGRAFVATGQDGVVRMIDLERATLLRMVAIESAQQGFGYARTLLGVDVQRGRVVAVTATGAVFVLEARTGAVLRAFVVPQSSSISGMVIDQSTGQILLGDTQAGNVMAVDPLTGAVRRRLPVGGGAYRLSLYGWGDRLLVVRVGTGGSAALDLDTRSGRLLATVPLGTTRGFFGGGYFGGANVGIDDRNGRAYVADARTGTVRVLDLHAGRVAFTVSTGIRPRAIAIDPRTRHLFVLDTAADQLRMFSAGSGALLRTVPVGAGSSALAVDGRSGRVLVAGWGIAHARQFGAAPTPLPRVGQLRILDARSGATLRTIAVGAAPVAIQVDEMSGHIVVISAGGTMAAADPLGWLPASLREHLPWLPARTPTTGSQPPRAEVLANAS
jgi:DNA-binding beta-propeller fold protein YncE